MPNPGNFNPEWGYLAPKPGFIRSARMALAAGAIGTVAGMAVAVALIAHPSVDVSVAAPAPWRNWARWKLRRFQPPAPSFWRATRNT